jgi:hypothetical protein
VCSRRARQSCVSLNHSEKKGSRGCADASLARCAVVSGSKVRPMFRLENDAATEDVIQSLQCSAAPSGGVGGRFVGVMDI